MVRDGDLHREFDRHANGAVQVGELPRWINVRGKVAWYVVQDPYSKLGDAWAEVSGKVHASDFATKVRGPPGDVYV